MFQPDGKDRVRHEAGFAVEFLGHGKGVRYAEKGRKATVYAEFTGSGPADLILFPGSLRTWPGWRRNAMSDAEQRLVLARVIEALRFMGYVCS